MLRAIMVCAGLVTSASAVCAQASGENSPAIGYASVDEAYRALRAKAGVTISRNGDWTIVNDTDRSIWSFAPPEHPAYPSVGRRRLLQQPGGTYYVETQILCQAQKAACDSLYADYQQLDRRMTDAIRAGK